MNSHSCYHGIYNIIIELFSKKHMLKVSMRCMYVQACIGSYYTCNIKIFVPKCSLFL